MIKNLVSSLVVLFALLAQGAEPITGVQPAALDQPRVYVHLHRTPNSKALSAKVDKEESSAIEAFVDTGAGCTIIADSTATGIGVRAERVGNNAVTYEDIGVGGAEKFGVSEPLFISTADYSSNTDGDTATYTAPTGPFRDALKPAGLLDALTGGLDIVGMPAMQNRVIIMDPRPLAKYEKIRTSIVAANDRSIPRLQRTVPLTYVSFARFTRTMPAGAQGPAIAANPMIGPDPFQPADRSTPITARYHNKSARLTMLLDTGAVASMISTRKAAELGVTYAADGSTLVGVPKDQQFSLAVGGIGGSKTSSGFYLDLLALPAKAGEPIVYAKAPLLVCDITIADPATKKPFTLDGVFGMNFLVASANLSGGLLPDIDKIVDGPFQTIVIDHARRTLGVK